MIKSRLFSMGPRTIRQDEIRRAGIATSANQRNVRLSIAATSMATRIASHRISGDGTMQAEVKNGHGSALQKRPLEELLRCPPAIGNLLNQAAQTIEVGASDVVFRQSSLSKGLYVIVSGQFARRAERMSARLALGMSRAGDLVELAAVLGDGTHTYTLSAQIAGSVVLLPMEALVQAFEAHPPMRMRLLEELAREVSRGYDASCQHRMSRTRRRSGQVSAA